MAAQVPGARNIAAADLTPDMIVSLATESPEVAQTTIGDLADFVGLNSPNGTFDLDEATPVAVANENVTADSVIVITLKTVGGTVGAVPAIQTITPGVGFTVAGTALDTSTYNYLIIN